MNNENKMYIETIVGLFMVEESMTKILLVHKTEEPYKGYWMLPRDIVNIDNTIFDTTKNLLDSTINYSDIYLKEVNTFSRIDRDIDKRVVGVSYIGVTDPVTVSLKFKVDESLEYQWFDIYNLPKLAYDHEEVVNSNINYLKENITKVEVLKALYPGDFTLPELQRMFEKLLNITIDRRNFRKKLINLDWVFETDHMSDKRYGRPSKVYYFVENMKNRSFFSKNNKICI